MGALSVGALLELGLAAVIRSRITRRRVVAGHRHRRHRLGEVSLKGR
jgi:hypothetical protein